MSKYDVVVWSEEGVWTAHSPSVPGVYGLGKSRRAAVADFKLALSDEIAYQKQIGQRPSRQRRIFLDAVEI